MSRVCMGNLIGDYFALAVLLFQMSLFCPYAIWTEVFQAILGLLCGDGKNCYHLCCWQSPWKERGLQEQRLPSDAPFARMAWACSGVSSMPAMCLLLGPVWLGAHCIAENFVLALHREISVPHRGQNPLERAAK